MSEITFVSEVARSGVNRTWVGLHNSKKVVVKESNPVELRREKVVADICQLFFAHLEAPVYDLIDHNGRTVGVQSFIEDSVNFGTWIGEKHEVDPEDIAKLSRKVVVGIIVLDYLIRNTDRHPWNLMYNSKRNSLHPIDHGYCLDGYDDYYYCTLGKVETLTGADRKIAHDLIERIALNTMLVKNIFVRANLPADEQSVFWKRLTNAQRLTRGA